MSDTNITDQMKEQFEALTSGEYTNFAIFSCFADGKPTAAICAINESGEEYTITPLVIFPPEGMILTDHDGTPA